MTFFKIIIILLTTNSITIAEIPENIKKGKENARTLGEFLSFGVSNDSRLMADFNRNQYKITDRCDLKEMCPLIQVCVPIEPDANAPESLYFPRCVKLTKCIDVSYGLMNKCHPMISLVNITVIHYKHVGNSAGYHTLRHLKKENHTSCIHEDQQKPVATTTSSDRLDDITTPFSDCDSHNQCEGNEHGEQPKSESDCTGSEQFSHECCSCICPCNLSGEVCNCPATETERSEYIQASTPFWYNQRK